MFRDISYIIFVIIFLGMVMHIVADLVKGKFDSKSKGQLHKFWWIGWSNGLSCFSKLKRIVLIVAVTCLIVMFITAFSGRLAANQLMTGYILMIHVGTAPVFIVCTVFLIVSWGYQCRLTENEWGELLNRIMLKPASHENSMLFLKLTFWFSMGLSVPVSLSMLASMFTIFGTHGQEVLFNIHQYTSLALVSSVVIHLYLLLRNQYK